jgi:hypothetical protein
VFGRLDVPQGWVEGRPGFFRRPLGRAQCAIESRDRPADASEDPHYPSVTGRALVRLAPAAQDRYQHAYGCADPDQAEGQRGGVRPTRLSRVRAFDERLRRAVVHGLMPVEIGRHRESRYEYDCGGCKPRARVPAERHARLIDLRQAFSTPRSIRSRSRTAVRAHSKDEPGCEQHTSDDPGEAVAFRYEQDPDHNPNEDAGPEHAPHAIQSRS